MLRLSYGGNSLKQIIDLGRERVHRLHHLQQLRARSVASALQSGIDTRFTTLDSQFPFAMPVRVNAVPLGRARQALALQSMRRGGISVRGRMREGIEPHS